MVSGASNAVIVRIIRHFRRFIREFWRYFVGAAAWNRPLISRGVRWRAADADSFDAGFPDPCVAGYPRPSEQVKPVYCNLQAFIIFWAFIHDV
jgi:hypothetical protein